MAGLETEPDLSWPQVDPDFTLQVLAGLKGAALPNGKPFWKSYTKWNKMDSTQRNKSTAFFNSLSDRVKIAVRTKVENMSREAGAAARHQASVTSANDRARFMHAMVDPKNQVALTAAMTPMDRRQLDSAEERTAPWDKFAENFNNYDDCKYQNATILYVNGNAVNPYQARCGFESMALHTHNINPQEEGRPARDGAWCEKMWKEIRGYASRINENYRKSGNQDAENQNTEWLKFCDNYSEVYKYARAVLDDGVLDNLGRALPGSQQRDTAATGGSTRRTRTYSNTPGAVNRRRQRARANEIRQQEQDGSPLPSGGASTPAAIVHSLTAVVQSEMTNQRRLRALEFLANYEGNDPDRLSQKRNALVELEAEAGLFLE
mmetsp:Transcript_9373/g.17493  ORF Transcript_9373/g.17493 Transcript_9373/m.17493 type:complete len:377 (-) Transcript_9373:157-1287(-)